MFQEVMASSAVDKKVEEIYDTNYVIDYGFGGTH